MKFDDLDKKMRVYEMSADLCVLPDMFMIARLDGRGFTRLTKDTCDFEAPFDVRFRDLMVATTESMLTCGFRVLYAYTESDETSLLLDPREQLFGRKLRKYNSTLAGEASAQFSVRLGQAASFDCRISQLPNMDLVVDYFRWRNEDAARNALNAWCYWTLRNNGFNQQQATRRLLGLSVSHKNDLLFQFGINFNELPRWQKRGVGLYWEDYDKPSVNPITNQSVVARRRRVRIDYDLPMKGDYGEFVRSLLSSAHNTRSLMMGTSHGDFIKYPRTPHLFGSKGTDDDKHLCEIESSEFITDDSLIVEEKIDGTNVGMHFSDVGEIVLQCRGHVITEGMHPQYDLFKQWAAVKRFTLEERLEHRFILFGEWVFARHSIFYRRLSHYFFEFDIYDKQAQAFLDLQRRQALLEGTGIETVPVIHTGAVERDGLEALIGPSSFDSRFENPQSKRTDNLMEGLYLRTESAGVVTGRAKFVRPEFVEKIKQSTHWQHQAMVPNELAEDVDIWS